MAYNGWRNRETWLVSVWFDPENINDLLRIKEELEDQHYNSEALRGFWNDMINFTNIDWDELENYVLDEMEA